jgi:hypothetical protein
MYSTIVACHRQRLVLIQERKHRRSLLQAAELRFVQRTDIKQLTHGKDHFSFKMCRNKNGEMSELGDDTLCLHSLDMSSQLVASQNIGLDAESVDKVKSLL